MPIMTPARADTAVRVRVNVVALAILFASLLAGVAVAAATGTPVRAVAAGTVVVAEEIGTYGLTVIVQHGSDYSVYGSLARADVRRGAAVQRGQPVGTVGAADPELPPHLHFELRPGGRAVDPLDLLRAAR